MIEATCHCGNVRLSTESLPRTLTRCNCSICHRVGALWAYYTPAEVKVEIRQSESVAYLWGDRDIEFHHCPLCGCVTHYLTTDSCEDNRLALNARMVLSELIQGLAIREHDGASAKMRQEK